MTYTVTARTNHKALLVLKTMTTTDFNIVEMVCKVWVSEGHNVVLTQE